MGKNVIIACDFNSKEKLENFLDKMESADSDFYCKVGMELFYAGSLQGFNPIEIIKKRGHKVFLDLKLKDIPNTVSSTVKVLVQAGVDMLNVHADGGFRMMNEVVKAVDSVIAENRRQIEVGDLHLSAEIKRPILLGVTVLTSMGNEELKNEINIDKNPMEQVVHLAKLCQKAGFDGVVCSPEEIMAVKEACGANFVTVTPGIRYRDNKKDDQTRVATPICANLMGADFIVVGRPITQANDPIMAFKKIKEDFTEYTNNIEEIENARAYIKEIMSRNHKDYRVEVAKSLLNSGCVTYNFEDPYLLNSGIVAPIYCDNRDLYGFVLQRNIVVEGLINLAIKEFPDTEVFIGVPSSGIPYASIIGDRLGQPFGYGRKAEKDHGKGKMIEGKVKGKKVLVVEDLVSTGDSVIKVVENLKAEGANVIGIVSIVRNNAISLKPEFVNLNIKYSYITDMILIARMALEQGRCTKEDYYRFMQYVANPYDESWMSEGAKQRILEKRNKQVASV